MYMAVIANKQVKETNCMLFYSIDDDQYKQIWASRVPFSNKDLTGIVIFSLAEY